MKISLNWIEEILGEKLNCSWEELSEKLLALGFEVTSCQSYPQCLGVVVAQILEISKHPHADRLKLAKVTDGKETEKVVCGAPNIEIGQKVFWAKVGARLSDGQIVKKSSIRGIHSPGMLCSAKELGVGEDHTGIWILGEDLQVGKSLEEIILLQDTIFEVEVPPNRPDCLSHLGLAREIAIALNLRPPESFAQKISATQLPFFPVEIEAPSACKRYIARRIEDIRVAPSPFSLQVRLLRCGIRPINNVVDITNLILLETGQPLHAFDLEKLEGGKIVVRRAKTGEKILALDGKSYPLNPEILIIADAKKPVAIAGVMGGEESATTSGTKSILLESALFDRRLVRMSRKILNLSTESSYRFERGVSYWSSELGSQRAEKMILQIAGGKCTAYSDVIAADLKTNPIVVHSDIVEKYLSEKIPQGEIISQLERLGVRVCSKDEEKIVLQSPPWRLDLNLEIDFIEEIARLRNYEKIPSSPLYIRIFPQEESNQFFVLKKRMRSLLEALGFSEAMNYGLISKKLATSYSPEEFLIFLQNPLSQDQEVLRTSLLIELLKNLKLNLSYQKKDVRLFELGRVFQKINSQPKEGTFLAAVATGSLFSSHWSLKGEIPVDFFWLKGVIEKIFQELKIPNWKMNKAEESSSAGFNNAKFPLNLGSSTLFHPATLLDLLIQVQQSWWKVGNLGLLHPSLAKTLQIPKPVALFELNLTLLKEALGKRLEKFSPLHRTPTIQRDCSIWVGENIRWEEVESEIFATAPAVLKRIELFDLYFDPNLPGQKSLSFTLTFQHPQKTLSDEEANQLRDKVITALREKFKAKLRERR